MASAARRRPHRLAVNLLPGLLVGLVLCVFYVEFFVQRAQVTADVVIHEGAPSVFKVYWARGNAPMEQAYFEQEMQRSPVSQTRSRVSVVIEDLARVTRLRIDPTETEGRFTLRSLTVTQPGFEPLVINDRAGFERLTAGRDIASARITPRGLEVETSGIDGQFELRLERVRTPLDRLHHAGVLGAILLLSLLLSLALAASHERLKFVPWLLLAATVMVLVMASISGFNVHPDEKAHLAAIKYYHDAWLPPALDDPAIADSYSAYGHSRLSSRELYYPAVGLFTRLLDYLTSPFYLDARLPGVLMILVLTVLAVRRPSFRPVALPLLITPQAWYLFSYSNSDGFALFVCLLVAYQATHRPSALNRFLVEDEPSSYVLKLVALGALMGALLLLKSNFYAFVLFLGGYLLWRLYRGDFPDHRRVVRRLGALVLIALAILGAREGVDRVVNGPDPSALRSEMAEQYAQPGYRPSAPLADKYDFLERRARGDSLSDLVENDRWGQTLVNSAIGSYGYTQYHGTPVYFAVFTALALLWLAVLVGRSVSRCSPGAQYLLAVFALTGALLVVAILMLNWIVVYQPQGRYLAPLLPMAGILCFHLGAGCGERLFNVLTVVLFALASYSFVCVGMANVDKVDTALIGNRGPLS